MAISQKEIGLIDAMIKDKDLYQISSKDIRVQVEAAIGKEYDAKEFMKVVIERATEMKKQSKSTAVKRKRKSTDGSATDLKEIKDKKKPKKPTKKAFKNSKINKLDDRLAAITGYTYLPYVVIMKYVWKYVRQEGLIEGKLVRPDKLISDAFEQTEPFPLVTVLSQKAKGLMEDVKTEEIPPHELKRTMALLTELDVENDAEYEKKLQKYELMLKKYNESKENTQIVDVEMKDVVDVEQAPAIKNRPTLILTSDDQ